MKTLLYKHKYAIFFFLLYLIVDIYFGLSSQITWDDDCPVRYYNTISAHNNPETFISIWNRPLFTIVFYLPLQLGKFMIPILMCLITAISSFLLYLALRKQEIKNAFLVIPFIGFQTFFFGISRNAESEPLAVALISLGYYLMVEKKWFWFALVGGLLPLARLELCLLFPFWGIILLQAKAYKQILLLILPFVLWNIAGGIITGDYLYVFEKTVGKENTSNRYGYRSFGHYFQRYIYVVGPIFFFLFSFGFWKIIRSKQRTNLFVFWQFVAGFMIYVFFSWKLNMGNSAGFMRHVTPMSSLAAIIALWGFNHWWGLIQKPKTKMLIEQAAEVSPEKTDKAKPLSRKKHKLFLAQQESERKKMERQKELAINEQQKLKRKLIFKYIGLSVFLGILYLLTSNYFSLEMANHQDLLVDTEYDGNLNVIMILIAFTIVLLLIQLRLKINSAIVGGLVGVAMILFTAYTEPPNANTSIERELMEDVSNHFQNEAFDAKVKYINHVWFYWANDLDRYSSEYADITMANLDSAEIGSLCVWENHYSHRLAGDVQIAYFTEHPEWVKLSYYSADSSAFRCNIYEKLDTNNLGSVTAFENYIENSPPRSENYVSLGNHYFNVLHKSDSALYAYDQALGLKDSNIYAIFGKGIVYFKEQDWEQAEGQFIACTKRYPKWINGWLNLGTASMKLKKFQESIQVFTKAIEIDEKRVGAYMNRAVSFLALEDTASAITDFSNSINLDRKNWNAYSNRGVLFFKTKLFSEAAKDFEMTVSLNPNYVSAWRLLGVTRLNLNEREEAKKALEQAALLNDQYAAQLLQMYFTSK